MTEEIWWHRYLKRMLTALRRSDPQVSQVGGPWNDIVYHGQRYWPRYVQEDGLLAVRDRQQLYKAKQDGIAGLLIVSMTPGTRVWLLPIDRALDGFVWWKKDGHGGIEYKKWGRSA